MSAANCAMRPTHEHERQRPNEQIVDPHRGDHDADRLDVKEESPRTRYAGSGYAAAHLATAARAVRSRPDAPSGGTPVSAAGSGSIVVAVTTTMLHFLYR